MARTGYHLVDISPWPFCASVGVLGLASSTIGLLHLGPTYGVSLFFFFSVLVLGLSMVRWWGDVILESTYLGRHTNLVVRNLRVGMVLFIMSEIFFFASFFWAFFNSMLGEISMLSVGHWPPTGVKPIFPWKVPALNTAVLISSGITLTWSHKALKVHNKCPIDFPKKDWTKMEGLNFSSFLYLNYLRNNKILMWFFTKVLFRGAEPLGSVKESSSKKKLRLSNWHRRKMRSLYSQEQPSGAVVRQWSDWEEAGYLMNNPEEMWAKQNLGEEYRKQVLVSLGITIMLGVYFTWLQFNEYYVASFTIADSVYGSTFYLMTGFHGVHVLVGTIFLIVCWFRAYFYHFSYQHHYFGFDAAVWYWHFVDGVWVLLFFSVYVWGYL